MLINLTVHGNHTLLDPGMVVYFCFRYGLRLRLRPRSRGYLLLLLLLLDNFNRRRSFNLPHLNRHYVDFISHSFSWGSEPKGTERSRKFRLHILLGITVDIIVRIVARIEIVCIVCGNKDEICQQSARSQLVAVSPGVDIPYRR